jgi:hypothetical protein
VLAVVSTAAAAAAAAVQVHGTADADVPVGDAREIDALIQVGHNALMKGLNVAAVQFTRGGRVHYITALPGSDPLKRHMASPSTGERDGHAPRVASGMAERASAYHQCWHVLLAAICTRTPQNMFAA